LKKQKYNDEDFKWWTSPAKNSANQIVPYILEHFPVCSVLDIGCAEGVWLSKFKDFGVQKILGLDGPWVNTESLHIPVSCFRNVNLASYCHDPKDKFDLSICLEVAEHLDENASDRLISNLTVSSNLILFSAAVPEQGGQNHVNEQPPFYWKEKFAERGFKQFDLIRAGFWDNENVAWWYRQNIMIYSKNCISESFYNQYTDFHGFHIIHPTAFAEKCKEISIENASARNLCKALIKKFIKFS
jgi:hypothetical protein